MVSCKQHRSGHKQPQIIKTCISKELSRVSDLVATTRLQWLHLRTYFWPKWTPGFQWPSLPSWESDDRYLRIQWFKVAHKAVATGRNHSMLRTFGIYFFIKHQHQVAFYSIFTITVSQTKQWARNRSSKWRVILLFYLYNRSKTWRCLFPLVGHTAVWIAEGSISGTERIAQYE